MEIRISIITINLNNKIGLEKTIQSVINQSYSHIEYIIIDGNSTDGSQELLSNPKIFKAISEDDSGIYNAMNKGIQLASGEYCLFLNSGDFLVDMNVIEKVSRIITERNSQDDIIYGDLKISTFDRIYPDNISLNYLLDDSLPHPSSFIRRTLFNINSLNVYRENYKIVSDWIFFFDAFIRQYKFRHLNLFISVYEGSGISDTNKNLESIERDKAMKDLYSNFSSDFEDLLLLKKYRRLPLYRNLRRLKLILNKFNF
ncbi:glycosyltransferase family 2 protein [Pedobacter jejuensis]|uniref:Glycosyltransferase n=1 Tax=Pedobacter jejuensis TaxID=1268550 RepID=A0A3N0BQ84_9SPHI|nr:glycosyltransferase family 2 protein [Pedobacter jejuensis]RNL51126.1 glycosyltransferase [Pedobacter jejuensis]